MNDPLELVGQVLEGKYLIQQFVSEGGFASVYRAEHVIWKKPVAIKLFSGLSSAPEELRESLHQAFIQEGAFLSELCTETASIVQPRDVGAFTAAGGQWLPYMVLEWLDGQNLDQLLMQERSLQARPWQLPEVIALLSQVAMALDIAHAKGIAHRDVKPSNLFLVSARVRAEIRTIKLLDFGVAKLMVKLSHSAALVRTGANVTSFTPQYAAPEQFNRELGATGPWTDVYSLALVAVELLAGRSPTEGNDVEALGSAAMNATRRPTPRALGLSVSTEVEDVFARALAVMPAQRYHRAGQFWLELETASGLPMTFATRERASRVGFTPLPARPLVPGSTPPHVVTRAPTAPPRRGLGAIVAALAVGLAAAAAVLIARRAGSAHDAGQRSPAPLAAAARLAPSALASAPPPAPECPDDSVKIPAGQFFMGSEQKDAEENEKPSHHVTLDAFCMDLHEVTAAKYKACSDVGQCKRAPKEVDWPKISDAERKLYSPLCTFDVPEKQNHPINCVTWEMADNFCTVNGKRLPTEAEWEFATRGPDGRVYPWGDEAPSAQHLNACGTECSAWGKQHATELTALYDEDDGYVATAPVGSFPKGRSRFGPYDVVGNVWEWTSSWYGPYTSEKSSNPRGPAKGERRVIRGGAFNGGYASWLHPAFRYGQVPEAQSHGIGFRCAASIVAPSPG
ncbi:MAG TPA: bifunctional serine/threonine-protein kinase/formylglycine-generating enzyme family protein [Polyangiaceae bacterium]|jgi:formylglycine-generating enzyme required for sulfatase activity